MYECTVCDWKAALPGGFHYSLKKGKAHREAFIQVLILIYSAMSVLQAKKTLGCCADYQIGMEWLSIEAYMVLCVLFPPFELYWQYLGNAYPFFFFFLISNLQRGLNSALLYPSGRRPGRLLFSKWSYNAPSRFPREPPNSSSGHLTS